MAEVFKRQFLEFEQPIKELYEHIEDNQKLASKNPKMDYEPLIKQLEDDILVKRKEITEHLTAWQKVQLSRHPERPYTLDYIENMTTGFIEQHGDRNARARRGARAILPRAASAPAKAP